MCKSRVYRRQFTEKNTVYMYVRYRFHYDYAGENMLELNIFSFEAIFVFVWVLSPSHALPVVDSSILLLLF